jgi:uncharacterized protein YqeY
MPNVVVKSRESFEAALRHFKKNKVKRRASFPRSARENITINQRSEEEESTGCSKAGVETDAQGGTKTMSLQEQISAALKDAMRARDEVKMATLRLVLTAVKNREKEARSLLEDQEVISVITSQMKQRLESIEQYRKGGREDLAQTEENELQILQGYMPEQVSEEEISNTLDEIIAEVGAVSMKDMGKVMKAAMAKLAGKADGRAINAMVKAKLSG